MSGAVIALYRKFERLIRYGAVGAGVTLFYSLLTTGLIVSRLILDPTTASAVATVVTQPLAFALHRAVTYQDVAHHETHWRRFATVALSSFVLGVGAMKLVDSLGWPFWIALAIGWVIIPVVNYFIGAIWVFRARKLLSLAPSPSLPRGETQ